MIQCTETSNPIKSFSNKLERMRWVRANSNPFAMLRGHEKTKYQLWIGESLSGITERLGWWTGSFSIRFKRHSWTWWECKSLSIMIPPGWTGLVLDSFHVNVIKYYPSTVDQPFHVRWWWADQRAHICPGKVTATICGSAYSGRIFYSGLWISNESYEDVYSFKDLQHSPKPSQCHPKTVNAQLSRQS